MSGAGARSFYRPERALAFSDAVFGVAITLLVIDLRLPETVHGDAALLEALRAMVPKLLLFGFTFLIVGAAWLAHHRKFSLIERVDGRLLWINLIYLMALCLVPFASSVLGEHGSRYPFAIYAAVMAVIDTLSAILSAYALRPPFLAGPLFPGQRLNMILAPALIAVVFAAAAAMALGGRVDVAPWILLLIVPVMWFFGSRARRSA